MTLVHEETRAEKADALAENFLGVVSRLQFLSRSPAGNLSNARFGVLQAVECRGTPPMNTVARAVGVTPRTLTDLVDGLETAQLLRRIPNPADRREILLELTDAGAVQVSTTRMARATLAGQIFQSLTPPERQALSDILDKLLSNGPVGSDGSTTRG